MPSIDPRAMVASSKAAEEQAKKEREQQAKAQAEQAKKEAREEKLQREKQEREAKKNSVPSKCEKWLGSVVTNFGDITELLRKTKGCTFYLGWHEDRVEKYLGEAPCGARC